MVNLSDTAKTVIERLIAESEVPASGLRILIEQGGCSGLRYMLGLENEAREGDQVFDYETVKIFVDSFSAPIVDGMRIDFVDSVESAGFVFENPNAGNMCSCGKSFQA